MPLYDGDPAEIRTDHDSFEDAELNGRRHACMGGVTEVGVYNDDRQQVAYYRRLINNWFAFTDSEGNFISRDEYFEAKRIRTEEYSAREGLKIEIRVNDEAWAIVAGDLSTVIDPDNIPWVNEAVESLLLKKWRREDNEEPPYKDEELSDIFNGLLRERISLAVNQNPDPVYRLSTLPLTLPPSLAIRG